MFLPHIAGAGIGVYVPRHHKVDFILLQHLLQLVPAAAAGAVAEGGRCACGGRRGNGGMGEAGQGWRGGGGDRGSTPFHHR